MYLEVCKKLEGRKSQIYFQCNLCQSGNLKTLWIYELSVGVLITSTKYKAAGKMMRESSLEDCQSKIILAFTTWKSSRGTGKIAQQFAGRRFYHEAMK